MGHLQPWKGDGGLFLTVNPIKSGGCATRDPIFFPVLFRIKQLPFPVYRLRITGHIEGIVTPADKRGPFTPLQGAESVIDPEDPGILIWNQLNGRSIN